MYNESERRKKNMLNCLEYLTGRFITLISNFNIEYGRYFFDLGDFNDKSIGILGPKGVGKQPFCFNINL